MVEAPTTAYTEVQVDEDSISLSLISEGRDGVTIEDTERFTFEELKEMEGEHLTLSLSVGSQESLSEIQESATVGNLVQSDNLKERAEIISDNPSETELLAYMGLLGGDASDGQDSVEQGEPRYPHAGEVVTDTNAPPWSVDDRVEVTEVLSSVPAEEYVIQGRNESHVVDPARQDWTDETVADANPSYSPDEPVILARYIDDPDSDEYAFPASRLE